MLHQTAPQTRLRQVALRAIGDQIKGIAHLLPIAQPYFDPADVGFVQDVGRGDLEDDGVADLPGDGHSLIGRFRHLRLRNG